MEENNELQEIRIAVCDDEPKMSQRMMQIIREIMEKQNVSYQLFEFNSGKDLLEQIQDMQLVFLDLEMSELDGMETGLEIRNKNPECRIIIASAREDRMKETFRMNPMRFVSKPYEKLEIQEALETYLNEKFLGRETIEVYYERLAYQIEQRQIVYIEAYNSSVNIVVHDKTYRKELSMKQLEEQLNKEMFFKVHKSYIVNLYHVKGYNEKKVLFENTEVPLSKRIRKDFERAYMEFDVNYR